MRLFDGSNADLALINTCTVTNMADRKSRQLIHREQGKAHMRLRLPCPEGQRSHAGDRRCRGGGRNEEQIAYCGYRRPD